MITKIIVTPTRSTGFLKAGEQYEFNHLMNNLYLLKIDLQRNEVSETINMHEHIDTLTSESRSPHLWDGKDWESAGHWEVIELIETKEQINNHE